MVSKLMVSDFVLYKKSVEKATKNKYIPILQSISATFESGKVNAIMGPNGSGKTTLLNALYGASDNQTKTAGSIKIDGQLRNTSWFERVSLIEHTPYILQNSTVKEALQFSIDLKNNAFKTRETLQTHKKLLENLHLDEILQMRISAISAGEKKRAVIACDILRGKDVLIMDEPTSDLDSHIALSLMVFLKNLAVEKSKMIILTIHQPPDQIFKLFDNILLINKGAVAYSGSANQLIQFLGEKGINKPSGWTTSDFLFEAFYNESSFKAISDQKEHISEFLNTIRSDSEVRTRNAQVSNKSTKFVGLLPRMGEASILLCRMLHFFLDPKFFMALLLQVGVELISNFFISENSKSAKNLETLKDFVTKLFPTSKATLHPDQVEPLIDSVSPGNPACNILSTCCYLNNSTLVMTLRAIEHASLLPYLGSNILVETKHILRELSLNYYSPASFIAAFLIFEFLIFLIYTVVIITMLRATIWDTILPFECFRVAGSMLLTPISIAVSNSLSYSITAKPEIRSLIYNLLGLFKNLGMQYGKLVKIYLRHKPLVFYPFTFIFILVESISPIINFSSFINHLVLNRFISGINKEMKQVTELRGILNEIKSIIIFKWSMIYGTGVSSLVKRTKEGIFTGVVAVVFLVISYILLCRAFTTRVSL